MDPDLELLDRWCAGDKAAGNALFKRHFDAVYGFFENKVRTDVDELVQETFLACVHKRDRFRRQSSFRTFLFAIARFELYRHWRRHARSGEVLDFSDISLAQLGTTPATRMARDQAREQLLAALRSLPLEQQLLLELHYWEGMESQELAEVFDIAAATARTRLFRARHALRERMEQLEDNPALTPGSVENFDEWVLSLRAGTSGPAPAQAARATDTPGES